MKWSFFSFYLFYWKSVRNDTRKKMMKEIVVSLAILMSSFTGEILYQLHSNFLFKKSSLPFRST